MRQRFLKMKDNLRLVLSQVASRGKAIIAAEKGTSWEELADFWGSSLLPEIERPERYPPTQSLQGFSAHSWLLWGEIRGKTTYFPILRLFSLHLWNPFLFTIFPFLCVHEFIFAWSSSQIIVCKRLMSFQFFG